MMQHQQPARPFKAAAVNVNGLAAQSKRREFFASLQEQRCTVTLLAETHCTSDDQARRWVQEGAGPGRPWQGTALWANQAEQGGRAAGGVGILLADSLCGEAAEPVVEHISPSGRVLKVSWLTPWGQRVAAVAVYAPCTAQDRPDFFLGEYLDALCTGTQQGMIVGGDFNCVMRPEDVLPAPGQQAADSGRLHGGAELQVANMLAGLQDACLLQHPGLRQPTHYTQQPEGTSGGRIDYIFLSQDLVDGGWLRAAQQHRRFPSDHRMVSVKLQPPTTPEAGPRRWRFPNHLLGVQPFVTQLEQQLREARTALEQQVPQLDPATLWERLKALAASAAQQLQQQIKSEKQQQLRRLRQALAAERRAAVNIPDQHAVQRQLAAEQALSAAENARLAQQAAATEPLYELYGEKSTYWFHQLGRAPLAPQFIAEVQRSDGSTVAAKGKEGVAAAGGLLADFYDPATGGLFSRHPTDPQQQAVMLEAVDKRLDEQQQQQCRGEEEDGMLTLREAEAALTSLPRGKAPGSDGLTYEFYTAMWEVVGEPLVAAFNYSFQQPELRLSETQRLGLITLIYKGGGKPRANPASYRPITLLNGDLKIVAKVMVHRFGPACASLIDETQTAFVPGRDIADNVLHHLEEIDYLQEVGVQQGQQGCILFLDFEKAYDRLDRDWLRRCMETMCFPESSMRWVRLLLAGTMGRIVFNGGHRSRVFDIPSGCAQGSPLSPLLYVIAAQPLAAKCRQLQREGSISSIRMPDGTPAPCSHQHADDTTLHAETVAHVRTLLHRAVEPFCAASGAKLNTQKCQGMVLGAHPALVGADPDTGVVFVDTAVDPIKHLGVPLSVRGVSAFAEQLYQQRLSSIGFRARIWGRYNLTLLGRCEVARQVLASCLVYHAQFVPVPEHLMRPIQRRISAFVLGLGCIRNNDTRQLQWRPAQQVACLPPKRGGIGCVDVQAHVTAMQAKVMASLLHPHRHAWKQFMRANLERAVPGVGVRLLVQQQTSAQAAAAQRRRLNPRHAASIAAFQALGVHRQLPHSSMTAQQIHLEPVVGNHSVANAVTGGLFSNVSSVPGHVQPRAAGVTLGQVAANLTFQPAVDGMVLPTEWQQTLMQPAQPQPEWVADTQSRWAWQRGEDRGLWWEVLPDGSLSYLDAAPAGPADTVFEPCCVVRATAGGPRRQRKQRQQSGGAQEQEESSNVYYLVGLWREVQLDPSVWGFGKDLRLLEYTVREATQRLVQSKCRPLPGWVPGLGVRPRLWRDSEGSLAPDTALQQLEAKHKRTFAEMMQQGFGGSSSSSGSGRRITDADQMAAYDAPWMHSSQDRQHVMQRVADRAAIAAGSQPTALRQQQDLQHVTAPAVNDTVDPLIRGLSPPLEGDAPWVAAYRRIADKRLPRPLRVFGWQLLHAAVRVGGSRVYAAKNMQELLQCCCRQPQCQPRQQHAEQQQPPAPAQPPQQHGVAQQQQQQPGAQQQLVQLLPQQQQQQQQPQMLQQQQLGNQPQQQQQQQQPGALVPGLLPPDSYHLESLTHVLVQCPVAAAAWAWFARVWRRVQPDAEVDFGSVRILLLDDGAAWQPPPPLRRLWTYMRLLLLESIWVVRCSSNGVPYSSRTVISRFLAALQQQLKQDWARTQGDIRLNSGVPLSWLKGCNPVLSQDQFAAKWRAEGILYRVAEGQGAHLCISLGT